MSNEKERRISLDEDDIKRIQNLQSEQLFKKLSLVDMFALAMIFGKKQGFRTPISKKKGMIRKETISNSNIKYLMMAIAAEETENFDVLAKKDDYFTISEEYAKTGINFLESEYIENPKGLLASLELEALKYFDKVVDE